MPDTSGASAPWRKKFPVPYPHPSALPDPQGGEAAKRSGCVCYRVTLIGVAPGFVFARSRELAVMAMMRFHWIQWDTDTDVFDYRAKREPKYDAALQSGAIHTYWPHPESRLSAHAGSQRRPASFRSF